MLPGVGFTEMILLVVLALVLVGPKDLPLMMRKVGKFTGRVRSLAFEFRQSFDELGRQAELEELKKEVASLKKQTGLEDFSKDMEKDQADIEREVATAMSGTGAKALTKAEGVAEAVDDKADAEEPVENSIGGEAAEAVAAKAEADDAKSAESKPAKSKQDSEA